MAGALFPVVLLAGAVLSVFGSDVPWYHNAVIYQIYPRSFMDMDGDGIGDLEGIANKADYLASLGISAVWLTSIYPSPNEDFGYDISEFKDVNPEYGTFMDFWHLVSTLKRKGIKVLLDFVPNHTSTQHEWFKYSEDKNDTVENYSDFYVWRNPSGMDKDNKPLPPNNWLSAMGTGSAWKWSEKRKQFYLHTFLEHQADLNFQNPTLHNKMEDLLKFWMKIGVGGFRLSAVNWLYEDPDFKDEPKSSTYDSNDPYNYNNFNHMFTVDLPSDVQYVQEVRAILDKYTNYVNDTEERLVFLDGYSSLDNLLPYYGSTTSPGGLPFYFLLLDRKPDDSSADWEKSINNYYNAIGNRQPTWVLGNHDWHRVASRWSDDWVDLLHIIMMTLRGTAITYYGEEIGLEDNIIRWDQLKDQKGILAGKKDYKTRSRDFQRAPLPWDDSYLGGFTKPYNITQGLTTWIPLAPNYWKVNVKAQESAKISHLKVYRALTKLRKEKTLVSGDCEVISTTDNILYIIRTFRENPTCIAAVNIGDELAYANIKSLRNDFPDHLQLLISSVNYPANINSASLNASSIQLPPKTGVVLSTSF